VITLCKRDVALKVDEAHYVVNRTVATMMAVGRSGRLELVAAWQHSEQFQGREIRAAIEHLLRHRITFAAGGEDARAAAVQAMSAYSDVIRDDAATRQLQRVLRDVVTNLPQFPCDLFAGDWRPTGRAVRRTHPAGGRGPAADRRTPGRAVDATSAECVLTIRLGSPTH
jgi:hypothetical protein